MNIKIIFALALTGILTGCKVHVDGNHHEIPYIDQFDIIDSYGVNSEFQPDTALAASPYVDDGFFELFWSAGTSARHRVELIINDTPTIQGGILLSSAWCGYGEHCTEYSYQHCWYRSDFTIQCEYPESTRLNSRRNISELIHQIPESLYLVLEVCDEDTLICDQRHQRVIFE